MAGADDVVKAALKLIAGGAKEAAPKAAIRAYHVSPHDFDVFKPSEFRGSTFFSSTPERAKRGAEAGRNEMGIELPPVNWRTYEVEIDPSRIKGLSLTPSESKWFEGLPERIVGDDALAEAINGIPGFMYWDDFYDVRPISEGVYEYTKKATAPSVLYEDAIKNDRSIYNRNFPHYNNLATDEKKAAENTAKQGMAGYLVHDEGGLSFAINDPSIVKILRKYAKGGSIREGYGPGGWVDDVVKMAGKVISGEGDDAAKAGIRAYQGSPHNFAAERLVRFPEGRTKYIVGQPDVLPDVPEGAEVLQDFPLGRMRMDKIGTGEGAQVYGHGLYLAEREGVAKDYRKNLAYKNLRDKFLGELPQDADFSEIEDLMSQGYFSPDQTRFLTELKNNDWLGFDYPSQAISAASRGKISNYDPSPELEEAANKLGHMYEVNINADPSTDFINYDAPWEDQPQKVKDAFSYLAKNRPDGSDLARKIEAPIFAQEASDRGVKGIQYLDAGSRAVGEGTRNYVVFDDKLISIIRKYGIAGASAMLGYNLMENLSPEQARAATQADNDYQSSGTYTGGMLPPGMEPSGELTSRIPSASDRIYDYVMSKLGGDDATKPQRAETIMNLLDQTPLGFAPVAYDVGRSVAETVSRADGGYVDDDIHDALRIAKDIGGSTSPAVMMEDAKGNKYDAQGKIIPPTNTGPNPQRGVDSPEAVGTRAAQDPATFDAIMERYAVPDRDIAEYEALKSTVAKQPQDVQQMTHVGDRPRRDVSVDMPLLGGEYKMGTAPYDVAGPMSGMAQTAYDWKTAPFYALPATAPFAMAADTAEGVATGDPLSASLAIGFGPGGKYAKAAGIGAVNYLMAPDEAQAGGKSSLVEDALRYIANHGEKAGIRAYHASPHDFDKFEWSPRTSMTGEGAQSYGAGLYFAESPSVSGRGGTYDKQFTRKLQEIDRTGEVGEKMGRVKIGGKPSTEYGIENDPGFIEAVKAGNVEKYARERLDRWHELSADEKYPYRDYATEKMRAWEKLLNDYSGGADVYYPMKARIYEANIAADPEKMMRWDEPLKDQPVEVMRGLGVLNAEDIAALQAEKRAIESKLQSGGWNDPIETQNPDEFWSKVNASVAKNSDDYSRLMKIERELSRAGKNIPDVTSGKFYKSSSERPENISLELRDRGVPGIQFWDGNSRGKSYLSQWRTDPLGGWTTDAFPSKGEATEYLNDVLRSAPALKGDERFSRVIQNPKATSNYVITNDKLISIVRKYGIAGASAMLGYNLMDQLDPKQALAAAMADKDYKNSTDLKRQGGRVTDPIVNKALSLTAGM